MVLNSHSYKSGQYQRNEYTATQTDLKKDDRLSNDCVDYNICSNDSL